MQRLEASGAVRLIYKSLGVKGLSHTGEWMASLTFGPGTRWRWVVGFMPRPIYPPGEVCFE